MKFGTWTSQQTMTERSTIQPFSQKSHTPTGPKEFQIGLYDPTEADLEHFWNSWSVGFLGERLYLMRGSKNVLGSSSWRTPRAAEKLAFPLYDVFVWLSSLHGMGVAPA